jgi:4-diphosphocytidyl-2-C-methyl-D-erythritol kinase
VYSSGKIDEMFQYFTNDFERALFPIYPQLAAIKRTFLEQGARSALLSGSGSVVFGVARDQRHAQNLAEHLRNFGTVFA